MTDYQKYEKLNIDGSWINLEKGDAKGGCFCTPKGAKVIGWENGIHYCFIRGYGETVFAVNPESCAEENVYPLAANFRDFLRLLLACGTTTAMEQIVWWSEAQFQAFLAEEAPPPERTAVLAQIREAFQLQPMENPFQYVKALQAGFDRGKLRYTDEYYEVTGRARPDGSHPESGGFEFPPVLFTFFRRNQDSGT